jgi:carbamoyltransferase
MNILGISWGYHDSAAALIVDGKVVAAVAEERLSRVKHDRRFPADAVAFCLEQAGLGMSDVDTVALHEVAVDKLARVAWATGARLGGAGLATFNSILGAWLVEKKLPAKRCPVEILGCDADRVIDIPHHHSHAASCFYASPFESAAVMTLDGVGEYETGTIWHGTGQGLEKKQAMRLPHSLGLWYSAFTQFLGFEVNEREYKVMGLAAYGTPRYCDAVRPTLRLSGDGAIEVDEAYFDFLNHEISDPHRVFTDRLVAVLGPPRDAEAQLALSEDGRLTDSGLRWADIAASVQQVAQDAILHVAHHALRITGEENLCMAGGVALNSVANGLVARSIPGRLWVQPAAVDDGAALGAALAAHHRTPQAQRASRMDHAYLGPPARGDRVPALLTRHGLRGEHLDERDVVARTADLLADGKIVGWVQGRAEWGPRALGARSILADPRRLEMRHRVNASVKFRELFRPFAPVVLAERADTFFELPPTALAEGAPERFMLSVAKAKPAHAGDIPAVVHADGTARVQIVGDGDNARLADLLRAFGERTGVPVLLNTSFNLKGEPMVTSVNDAVRTFLRSGIDALVVENWIIRR